jgi:hypothetical protein
MTRSIAMPSPSGQNREGLYLPTRIALDAKPASEAMSALQQFLEETLGPDGAARAQTLLTALLETLPAAKPDDDAQAQDRRRGVTGDGRIPRRAAWVTARPQPPSSRRHLVCHAPRAGEEPRREAADVSNGALLCGPTQRLGHSVSPHAPRRLDQLARNISPLTVPPPRATQFGSPLVLSRSPLRKCLRTHLPIERPGL